MTRQVADIFIAGAGLSGLVAALGLAKAGFQIALADPGRPVAPGGTDLRSTAYLQPARALLEDTGVWSDLAADAMPLEVLRVIDCQGHPPERRTERAFAASDLGAPAFGWNLPNALAHRVLTEAARDTSAISFHKTAFQRLMTRDAEARITLSDGTKLTARLAIAADGRTSALREAAGVGVEVTRYGQKALAFAVTHPVPHEAVSTELYLHGGAFVLVPLPDVEGSPASAVVWMNDGPEAKRLIALDEAAFSMAATERSTGILGDLTLATDRQAWPVVTQKAHRLTARRVALVAEAAHVLPPIGAQGLNTSLGDIRALIDLAAENPGELGNEAFLDRYARRRGSAIAARARANDLYNRICRSDVPQVQGLRALGLKLVHDIAPLRREIMRAGLDG